MACAQFPNKAQDVFNNAKQLNLNVVRVHSFADGFGNWVPLQQSPGDYNWQGWQNMDDMLYEVRGAYRLWIALTYQAMSLPLCRLMLQAQKNGQKVILPLVNYWEAYGGMDQYVAWSPTAWQREQFYTDWHCKQTYKNHLNQMVNRVNHNTGVMYKDDPTILAWQLVNEGRIGVNSAVSQFWSLQSWLAEMGAYLKSIDPNHMINAGTEGWFGPQQISGYNYVSYNPGAWGTLLGTSHANT